MRNQRRRILRPALASLAVASLAISGLVTPAQSADVPARVQTAPGRPAIGLAMTGTDLLETTPEKLQRDLDRVVASGASWVRVDLAASQFTWSKGNYSWRELDALVAAANARGIALLGVLSQVPAHARPAGSPRSYGPRTDAERAAFADYAETLASRYRGRILAYEVWNNPNVPDSWSPQPSVDDYAALLARTAPALRRADPNATIVAAGTGWSSVPGLASLDWTHGLYQAGAAANFDALGVHAAPNPNGTLGDYTLLDDYRAIMDRNGDGQSQLWVTQSGVSTGGPGATSEETQAKLLTAGVATWAGIPNHGPLFWDTLNDREDDSAAAHYGLVRQDGSTKPAWRALGALTGRTEDAQQLNVAAAAPKPAAPTTAASSTPTATPPAPPATTPAAVAPRGKGEQVGIAITGTELLFQSQAEMERDLDLVAATGARWVRVDVAPAQFTWVGPEQYHWDPLDRLVAAAQKRDIKILGVISQLPAYARPAGAPATHGPSTDAQRKVMADYSSKLAQRYRGRIAAYEIWSEANRSNYWTPAPNATDYVRLVTACRTAIKAADPGATVMNAGTGWPAVPSDPMPIDWIHQMYNAGLEVDAFAVHAYTMPWQQNWQGDLLVMDEYRKAVDQHDAGRQMWLTETGTTTGGSPSGTEAQAASYVPLILRDWWAIPNTGPVMYYTLQDRGGSDREGYFGFIRQDGSHKPAYEALRKALEG